MRKKSWRVCADFFFLPQAATSVIFFPFLEVFVGNSAFFQSALCDVTKGSQISDRTFSQLLAPPYETSLFYVDGPTKCQF